MTLIEGVGDEVVQFVAVLLLMVVAALAWWSTNARPDRYRTVLVMRARSHNSVTVSIRTRNNLVIANAPASMTAAPSSDSDGLTVTQSDTSDTVEEGPRETTRVIPLQEMDSIADADMAMLENNRMHFYRRMDAPSNPPIVTEPTSNESETLEEAEPASNAQIREMDSIVSAMEAEVTTGCDFFSRPSESNATSATTAAAESVKKDENKNDSSATASDVNNQEDNANTELATGDQGTSNDVTDGNGRKILIRLKYLNDTLREVDGREDELLKDFKLRHFSTELTSCRVRLIFNGRVLVDDAATLRACGLHHRAVVHCLVHPKRAANQRGASEEAPLNATHELITEGPQPERAWDLENILMTLVSVALTVVWFFRCEYSNMFTTSASVALFGLTVFYSVAIFGLYLSDTFHFDRRPAQGQPLHVI